MKTHPFQVIGLCLTWGQHRVRIDEKAAEAEGFKGERKLPREPGRVPQASSVPWLKILNPWKKNKR
jgi:3-mercaptopyruvate sulfurtransferase SseA